MARETVRRGEHDEEGPGLVAELHRSGLALWEEGAEAEAVAMIEEAVRIGGRLAREDPDDGLAILAMPLADLGRLLHLLGCDAQALPVLRDAVSALRRHREELDARRYETHIRRELLEVPVPDPDDPWDDAGERVQNLAGSLQALGECLLRGGEDRQALSAFHEAVQLHREAADLVPERETDSYLHALAESLRRPAHAHHVCGDITASHRAAEEATEIHQDLLDRTATTAARRLSPIPDPLPRSKTAGQHPLSGTDRSDRQPTLREGV